jgi:RNA polymerase sigma-70 factor (ECF subfamily)
MNENVGGKRERFENVALPFLPAAHNMARRLTRNAEDARDLVQETFLRAFRTFENFRPGTNCKAWLLTILY